MLKDQSSLVNLYTKKAVYTKSSNKILKDITTKTTKLKSFVCVFFDNCLKKYYIKKFFITYHNFYSRLP